MKQFMLNWKAQVKWQLPWPILVRSQTIWLDYPSYYSIDGVKKEVLSTQFESHFAREAFPSVDEPEAKATFDLSLKFDQEEGEMPFQICLKSMWRTAKKQAFGNLLRLHGCLLTSFLLLLEIFKGSQPNKKMALSWYLFNQGASVEKLRIFSWCGGTCHQFYEDYYSVKYQFLNPSM